MDFVPRFRNGAAFARICGGLFTGIGKRNPDSCGEFCEKRRLVHAGLKNYIFCDAGNAILVITHDSRRKSIFVCGRLARGAAL